MVSPVAFLNTRFAQCFGCGNKERLAKTVTALVWVAGVLTGILSLIGIFGAEFFLRLKRVDNVH